VISDSLCFEERNRHGLPRSPESLKLALIRSCLLLVDVPLVRSGTDVLLPLAFKKKGYRHPHDIAAQQSS
jgi:hypothetical protein